MRRVSSLVQFVIVVLVMPVASALADEPQGTPQREARVAWLKEHAVGLRSIDPADEDFADLEPLRKVIGDARIVQLGEQSHGDGAAFHAKARLIKFLHQKMGFDVLAVESGLYDCRKAWQMYRKGKDPYEAATHGIFGIWTMSEQFQPVIEYLGKAAKSERPLELCGFDSQFTAQASQKFLHDDVAALIERLGPQALEVDTRRALLAMIDSMVKIGPRKSPDEAAAAKAPDRDSLDHQQKPLKALADALAVAKPSEVVSAEELAFWRQYTASMIAQAEVRWAGQADPKRGILLRDAQMAKNMLWLAREAYPQRKIIVWAASYHVSRNAKTVQRASGPADYFRETVTMGDGVWKELGKETYTLAFIAAEGAAGQVTRARFNVPPPMPGSLEDLLVAARQSNAIIDFRQLDASGAWLREELLARPMSYGYLKADWTNVFDAVIFTRVMYPSTVTQRAKPPALQLALLSEGWIGPRKTEGGPEAGRDQQMKHGGEASGYLKSSGQPPFANMVQVIAADEYRGKRVRLSAFAKSEKVEGWAGLWMRVDGKEMSTIAFDNMFNRSIKGTTDWKQHEIVLDLPEESNDISFGALISGGKGQLWVDDFKFEIVGNDVEPTGMDATPRKRQGGVSANLPKQPRNLDFER